MSYSIALHCPLSGKILTLEAPHRMRSGTFKAGDSFEAQLNITYNYSRHFHGFGDLGVRAIYGVGGAASIPVIRAVAEKLGDDIHEDYWKSTEGNAKRALHQLIALAEMRPDGVWHGD